MALKLNTLIFRILIKEQLNTSGLQKNGKKADHINKKCIVKLGTKFKTSLLEQVIKNHYAEDSRLTFVVVVSSSRTGVLGGALRPLRTVVTLRTLIDCTEDRLSFSAEVSRLKNNHSVIIRSFSVI